MALTKPALMPWWSPILLLLAVGCANPVSLSASAGDRLQSDRLGNGPAAASLQVASPAYRVASTAHHWDTADIYEYDVTLTVRNASGAFEPLNPPAFVKLAQKSGTPMSTARFTGLSHGYYEASVVAMGNEGGTAASGALTPTATAALDLTVNDTADATASLRFDAVPFDATATVTLENPDADGAFATPATPASITVQ
ncbi:MAG TPA: hypothetical protein V6D47_10255 [Oscillatoriaceae cyanobacterium]